MISSRFTLGLFLSISFLSAQETRSTLFGTVLDSQAASIAGAKVTVRNALNYLIGGWQTAATWELQPGPLLDWGGTVFYRGSDTAGIADVNKTFDTWFNTANFERNSALGPNSFHRRQFDTRVPGIRGDYTNQWNANVSKNISISERINMQLRFDALNLINRSQMGNANTDPYSTNFGRVLSQTAATNRWLQVQARLTF